MPSLSKSRVTAAQAATELLKRRTARRKTLPFITYTFPDYAPNWHHERIAEAVDNLISGAETRLILCMPPLHGKSEIISRRLPARIHGLNPDDAIIACSHTADLAEGFCLDAQKTLESEPYRRLFPDTVLSPKRRRSDYYQIDGRRGFYHCAGVGGSITGRPARWLLLDDPLKGRNAAESPAERERTWRWLLGDFYTRRTPDARIIIVSTRWHEDDPVGRWQRLMEDDQKADRWRILTFPAVCEAEAQGDPRKPGDLLWPARFPQSEYDAFRAASPSDWAALYQQRPRGAGLVEWPDEFFTREMWFDDWPDCPWLVKVQACDPSKGKADKTGDFSALIDLAIDREGTLWVDADLDNTRPVEAPRGQRSIVNDGLARFQAWRPNGLIVETTGFQELVAAAFLRVARERGIMLPLYKYDDNTPKVVKIRRLGPYLAQKKLRVRNTKGGRLLVQQLREFPTAAHDDGPDGLQMAERLARELLSQGPAETEMMVVRA